MKREQGAASKSKIHDRLRDHLATHWREHAPRRHGERAAVEDVNAWDRHQRGVGVRYVAPLK